MALLPLTVQDDQVHHDQRRIKWMSIRRAKIIIPVALLCVLSLVLVSFSGLSMTPLKEPSHSADDKLKAELLLLLQDNPLVVFSKTYCPYSKKAKAILDSFTLKEPYKVVEVDLRDDADQVKQRLGSLSGRYTFPNIFVNEKSIGGAAELQEMNSHGELHQLLLRSHLI